MKTTGLYPDVADDQASVVYYGIVVILFRGESIGGHMFLFFTEQSSWAALRFLSKALVVLRLGHCRFSEALLKWAEYVKNHDSEFRFGD